MESLMTDGNKHMFKEENDLVTGGETEDYSTWDISYEEVPPGPSFPSNTHHSKTSVSSHPHGLKYSTNIQPSVTTKPQRNTPIQPDWQKVVGTKEKFFVYSAYHNSVFE